MINVSLKKNWNSKGEKIIGKSDEKED